MSKVLIVDDTNANIIYDSPWVVKGTLVSTSHEYNGTIHRGDTNGQTIAYTFDGTGITVHGSIDYRTIKGLAGVEFQVDDMQFQQINATGEILYPAGNLQSHQPLWKSPALSPGTHTINIRITDATLAGPYFYFDFFTVNTERDSVAGQVMVDDRDQSIEYVPVWEPTGVASEYMSTAMRPPGPDSYAILKFNGTEVYVYGTSTNINAPAQIGFELDGMRGLSYTHPYPRPSIIPHNLFFVQTDLADSEHTLKITALTSDVWTLDYIVYTTSNSSINTAALNGGSENEVSGSGSSSGSSSSITASGGGNGAMVGTPGRNTTNTAAIVGGIVGGLIGLGAFLLIAALILIRRRNRRRYASKERFQILNSASASPRLAGNVGGPGIISARAIHTAQALPPNNHQMMAQQTQPNSQSPLQHPQPRYGLIPAEKHSAGNHLFGQFQSQPNPMASGSSTLDSGSAWDLPSHSAQIRIITPTQHTPPVEIDSGKRFGPRSARLVEKAIIAPPVYTAD